MLDAKARAFGASSARPKRPFPLAGIDMPLVSPAALSVLPGSNRLVVADRGNKRVVIASPEGAFLRQIVSPAFTDLRSVAVDEGQEHHLRPQRRHPDEGAFPAVGVAQESFCEAREQFI